MASQDNLIIAGFLHSWKKLASEEIHLRKFKTLETERKLAAAVQLMVSHDNLIVAGVLQSWKKLHSEEIHLRKLQAVQREMEELKQRDQKRAFAAMMGLAASQDNVITASVFKVWK